MGSLKGKQKKKTSTKYCASDGRSFPTLDKYNDHTLNKLVYYRLISSFCWFIFAGLVVAVVLVYIQELSWMLLALIVGFIAILYFWSEKKERIWWGQVKDSGPKRRKK